jgi:hypothetical protein
MTKLPTRRLDERVSTLEELYRRWFQQTAPDDFTPVTNDDFPQQPQPRNTPKVITRTYTTYGAFEEPISFEV